jgi:DUF1365 family protein
VRSAIYTGTLVHARSEPENHVFRYPVCFYAIDLDEIPELDRRLRLFSYNRPGVVTLRDSDHLGNPQRPVADNIREYLGERGVQAHDARITMLTNLRVAGYVFNPVSFFYVHGPDGELRCILAEVSNTFGERLPYLLTDEQRIASLAGEHAFQHDKRMHVSPFFPLDQDYVFRMGEPGDTVDIRMDVLQDGRRPFWATLSGTRHDMTDRELARALARYPLMPLQVISLIHVEALRLWRKRVPFHKKPRFVPSEGSVAAAGDHSATERTRGVRPIPASGRSPLTPVVKALALRGLRRPVGGWFEVEMPDGSVHRMGSAANGPRHARVKVTGKDFFRRIARRGRVGFGEAYQAGDWTTDDLPAFLEILALTAEDVRRRPPQSLVPAAISKRPRLPNPADLIRARRDVQYHYDLGNDLYEVFLDDLLVRVLRARGPAARGCPAGQVPQALREAAHRAGAPRAGGGLRMGRVCHACRTRAGLPRHRHHAVGGAGRGGPPPRRAGGALRSHRHRHPGLPRDAGHLRPHRVDRDDRGRGL